MESKQILAYCPFGSLDDFGRKNAESLRIFLLRVPTRVDKHSVAAVHAPLPRGPLPSSPSTPRRQEELRRSQPKRTSFFMEHG